MDKNPTSDKLWEDPRLTSSDVTHHIRPALWGESKCVVTSDITVNPYPTLMSRLSLRQNGVSRGLHL